jgi:hypothetical protein
MDQIQEAFSNRNSDVMRQFGYRMKNQFSINEAYRRPKEMMWLEDLRQQKGIYDPDVKIDANNSKVYPKITRSKINIVLSRLHEMLFPERERNWSIDPTPEPKVSKQIFERIYEMVKQRKQILNGEVPEPPTASELRLAILDYAHLACDNMQNTVDDQLTEMDYAEETKKVLRSGLLYGTGIMKGPMVNTRSKHLWAPDATGEYVQSQKEEVVPYFKAIRIWDWYPDMTVTDIDQIEGSFERHLMSKHDLRELAKRSDYYGDLILEYLRDHPSGDYVPKNWEVDLQTIEVMAGAGNGRGSYSYGATNTETASVFNTESGNRTTNRQIGKKYQVLEYWGYVDGSDLEACGVEVPDVSLEYAANVMLLGNIPIKAALFEGALDQYKVFYYEKDETSLFGEGLARIMRHSQLAIAAAARMVLDNAACVAGPQIEVNWSLCTPDTDLDSFYPRKIWYREGRGVDAQYPALRELSFDSHIPDLLKIVDSFKQFGDEETTLPTWMIGQTVNNETAQATSGRMATITISIKDVVKNFDTFTERIIRDLYAWNMEFNGREDIKGDFNVKARGVSSLVMKEIRMQAVNQLMQTITPEDWVYLDRREFLAERLKTHDINVKLKTEEEAERVRQEQSNSIMNQLQIEAIKAEISKDKAQAMVNLTKAKEKNILANKELDTPPEMPQGQDPRMQEMEIMKAQAEIDDKKVQTAMKIDEQRMKAEGIAQKSQAEMAMAKLKMGMEVEKHKNDLEIKKQQAKHGMKIKETQARQKKPKKGAE